MMRKKTISGDAVFTYVVLIIFFVVVVYPLVWMFYSSFKPQWEIFANPFALPKQWVFDNYLKAWVTGHFGLYFLNSVIVTGPSVLGIVFLSSLAGYGFARFRFKGDTALFLFFLVGIILPPQAIIIPAFLVVSKLGLLNTYWGLIFTHFSWTPIAMFIIRAFFLSVPKEIIDSAKIDGCSEFHIYLRIALPLAKPAIAAVAIFYFVWVWNDFIYPLVYIQEESMNTIPLGVMLFKGKYQVDWGLQCAGLTIATVPAIIFYLIFQDKFVKGLTAGAVKG